MPASSGAEGCDRINHSVTNRLLQIAGCLTHHLCDRANLNQPLDNIGQAQPTTKGQCLSQRRHGDASNPAVVSTSVT
jgi:hypothetical protein